MKKLIILLATICTLSSGVFADSAKSHDVLQTIPGARNHPTIMAEASEPQHVTATTTKTTVKHTKKVKKRYHHPHKHPKK